MSDEKMGLTNAETDETGGQMLVEIGEKISKLTIEQSIERLFDQTELSDVCFLVGVEREKVYAHKIFLAVESEPFKSMLYKEMKENHEIPIPDLSPVGFRNMVKYFYTKKLEEISLPEIHPTYMAANKYLAFSLIQDLTDHITKASSDVSNFCLVYDQLLKLQLNDPLKSRVKVSIVTEFSKACKSDSFEQIGEDTLVDILKFEMLHIAEVNLLKACIRWTDSEAVRRNSAADQANKQKIFEPIKHLIRFGDLSLNDFSSITEIENYLTMEEIASIFLHIFQHKPIQIDYRSPRGPGNAQVARLEWNIRETQSLTYCSKVSRELSISVDRRVCISSIKTVAVLQMPSTQRSELKIYRDNENLPINCSIQSEIVDMPSAFEYRSWTITNLTLELEPYTNCKLRFCFLTGNEISMLLNKATTFKSDCGVEFKIELNSGKPCIDSVGFWRC